MILVYYVPPCGNDPDNHNTAASFEVPPFLPSCKNSNLSAFISHVGKSSYIGRVKRKLTRFQDFAESLLPHETGWLMDNHQLVDAEKIEILACLDHNTRLPSHPKPFDDTIDKRKYSYMIRWVQERLHSIDVDEQYKLITFLDQQIATDILQPEDEQQLSRIIRETNHRSFNFSRIFDLVRHYRHFLLIRMRYRQHKEADDFLRTYQAQYQHSRDINDKIHYATLDIVKQYAGSPAESIQWERWLTDVYNDENLDGNNRYMALVRLTFLYFNYRQFDRLVTKFDAYDALLEQGIYYSRRLLINYYNNRLLLHNYLEEYDKAIWYGFLSIREKNADYFHYVNTLSGVLLRQERFAEALEILRKAYSELRNVSSFHNRLLFITFYLRALHENGLSRNADNYAETFIRAYSDEIFDHRWHLFFTVVFDVLLSRERTSRIVHLARKYQLLRKEEEHIQRTGGLPYLKWQTALASFVEMRITRTQLEKEMATLSEQDISSSGPGLQIFKAHLKRLAPEITRKGRVG